jgi:ankyrin repeat protein
MDIDHIYDSGPLLSEAEINSYFQKLGIRIPDYYVRFLLSQNGGWIHPSRASIGGDDTLYRLYSVPTSSEFLDGIVKLASFPADETSLSPELLPLLHIGSTATSNLFMCLGEKHHGELVLFYFAHDELMPLRGTLQEVLAGLVSDESAPEHEAIEPTGEVPSPWSLVRQGKYEEIMAVVSDSDVDALSPAGQSLLMCAFRGCRKHLGQLLCEKGANVNRRDIDGMPAFFYSRNFLDGLKLAKKNDADFALTDSANNTVLHLLAEASCFRTGGETRCFQFLVDSGVPLGVQNDDGQTARDLLLKKVDEFELFYKDNPNVNRDNCPAPLKTKLRLLDQ